jgi:hypothetical protein
MPLFLVKIVALEWIDVEMRDAEMSESKPKGWQ